LIPEQVRSAFPAPSYQVTVADDGADGVARARSDSPDVILLDMRLPDQSGLEVYEQIRALDGRIPVIFVTVTKTADMAIEAMKLGAFDYLHKPLDLRQLRRVVGEAVEVGRRMRSPVVVSEAETEGEGHGAMFGGCPAMLEVYKAIGRVAAQDVAVLITGETGTGKELVGRAIYQYSARSKAPFLALNCAAIPAELLESELFGHEKGAFTGADRRRIGKFEQCNGGTLLLDEIGDMPLALQGKILRVLQEQTFERVGGNETIHTDVRVIASTHRNLKARAAEEKFRSDLYYRLSVFTIHLPPLRERGEDLQLLTRQFVRQYSRELGREIREIAPEALERLRAWTWPGNVRELQSVLKQALLNARGAVLLPAFLPELVAAPIDPPGAGSAPRPELDLEAFICQQLSPDTTDLYADTHRLVDRVLLSMALQYTRGNHRDAARMLGVSRQTMRSRFRTLGLQVTHWVEAGEDDRQMARTNGHGTLLVRNGQRRDRLDRTWRGSVRRRRWPGGRTRRDRHRSRG
jgi:two-component system nitrogen regulation response regulator GlnG